VSRTSTKAIRKAIVEAIRKADGAGDYVYDLRPQGVVVAGQRERPDAVRGDVLVAVHTGERDEVAGPSLRDYTQTGQWVVTGWARGRAHTPETRQDAAEDLADDIRQALAADRTLGGLVLTLELAQVTVDPASQGAAVAQEWGVVVTIVSAQWRLR